MTPRTPPQNIAAEQALLGECLTSPVAFKSARRLVSDDDWYQPRHELVWRAMRALIDKGEAADAITVAAELTRQGQAVKLGNEGIGYLHTLTASALSAGSVRYHANLVAEAATRRRIIEAANRMAQRAYESEASIAELVIGTQAELDIVGRLSAADGDAPGLATWHDFYAEHLGKVNAWVVPGMIGRKDVWMILSPPGAGKTMLSRQVAWMAAAGRHPFKPDHEITPVRTLLVDLENDEGMAAEETIDFFGRIDSLGEGVGDRGWVWARPQGINLRDPADRALLDAVMDRVKPDLVCLGSLYKSFARTAEWDVAVGEARDAFDWLRVKHQCALWLEHHMPKSSDGGRRHTPLGSYIWEAWPSHGRVLERAADSPRSPFRFVADFRGDRGKREVPVGFTRGGPLPWDAVWDEAHLDYLIESAG